MKIIRKTVLASAILSLCVSQAAVSGTTSYTYNDYGQVTSINGPRVDVTDLTQYTYDAQGNRTQISNALNHTVNTLEHDGAGRPLRIQDANGIETVLTYDARGRLLTSTRNGQLTQFSYNGTGDITQIISPDGSQINNTYDAARRLIAIEDGQGNRVDYTLDAMGNRLSEQISNANGDIIRSLSHAYDELGRLITTTDALGNETHYSYNVNDQQTGLDDALNRNTGQSYDALGRLVRMVDPEGNEVTYSYDAQDNLTSVTNAKGDTTTYTYDGLNNLLTETSPDRGTISYTYDEANNRINQTDAENHTTQYRYDALNRLTQVQYHNGETVTYGYDQGNNGIGQLTNIADTNTTLNYQYNADGQITQKAQGIDQLSFNLHYHYGNNGQLIGVQYPSGTQIAYSYDSNGQIQNMTYNGQALVSNIQHQAFGPITAWTWFNGRQAQRSYDQAGRMTEHPVSDATRSLSHDAVGNITAVNDPNFDLSLSYDNLDRITSALGTNTDQSFSYDANGNRTQQQDQGETTDYQIEQGSNRLLQTASNIQTNNYQYDNRGNIIDDGEHSYQYDTRDRLITVDNGNTATYQYNPLGERIVKTTGQGSTGGAGNIDTTDYVALLAQYASQETALNQDITTLQSQQSQAQQNQATAQTALNTASQQVSQLQNQQTTQQHQLNTKDTELATLAQEVQALQQQLQDLQQQKTALEQNTVDPQQIAQLQSEINAIESLTTQAQAKAAEAAQHQAQAQTLASQRDELLSQIQAGGAALTEHEATLVANDIKAANGRIAQAQGIIDHVNKREGNLTKQQANYQRLIDLFEGLKYTNPTVSWQHNVNRTYDRNIQMYTQRKATVDQQLQADQAKKQAQETVLAQEQNLIQQLEAKQQGDTSQLQAQADRLDSQYQQQITLVNTKQAEAEQLNQQYQHQATQLAVLKSQLAAAQQGQDNQAQIDQLDTQIAATQQSLSHKQTAQTTAQQERATLASQLSATQTSLAQAQAAETQATTDLAQYTQALTSIATSLSTKQQNLTDLQQQIAAAEAAYATQQHQQNQQNNPTAEKLYFVYDQAGQLIGEYDEAGNLVREIIYLGTMPVALAVNNELYAIHTDHLNTPRAIEDSNQQVVWRWDSDPFGTTEANEDPDNNGDTLTFNLRFPGQYFDVETQKHYNYFRDYDPTSGRYIQSDPIGLDGGLNTYAYVGSNPMIRIDPLGLAEALAWQPVGSGSSSFGHSSTNVNGKSYSWGPRGMDVRPSQNYMDSNRQFRSGMGFDLGLSPEEDDELERCLQQYSSNYGEYNFGTNNCTHPVQNCMKDMSMPLGGIWGNGITTPAGLGFGIGTSRPGNPIRSYPKYSKP